MNDLAEPPISNVIPLRPVKLRKDDEGNASKRYPITDSMALWYGTSSHSIDFIEYIDHDDPAQVHFTFASKDRQHAFECRMDAYESDGILSLYIMCSLGNQSGQCNQKLRDLFMRKHVGSCGQFQIRSEYDDRKIAYYSCINYENVVKNDEDYFVALRYFPRMIHNLFMDGCIEMNRHIIEFLQTDEAT